MIENLIEGKDDYIRSAVTYAQRTEKQIDRSLSYIPMGQRNLHLQKSLLLNMSAISKIHNSQMLHKHYIQIFRFSVF